MGKCVFILRTSKSQFWLVGVVIDWRKQAWEYSEPHERTTIALVRPHKHIEGSAAKLLGYDKTNQSKSVEKDTK